MFDGLSDYLSSIVTLLPSSPFTKYIDYVSNLPYLKYLNWFIPVHDILLVLSTWLVAIVAYYLVLLILKWVKLL